MGRQPCQSCCTISYNCIHPSQARTRGNCEAAKTTLCKRTSISNWYVSVSAASPPSYLQEHMENPDPSPSNCVDAPSSEWILWIRKQENLMKHKLGLSFLSPGCCYSWNQRPVAISTSLICQHYNIESSKHHLMCHLFYTQVQRSTLVSTTKLLNAMSITRSRQAPCGSAVVVEFLILGALAWLLRTL